MNNCFLPSKRCCRSWISCSDAARHDGSTLPLLARRRFGAPPVGRAAADDMTVLKVGGCAACPVWRGWNGCASVPCLHAFQWPPPKQPSATPSAVASPLPTQLTHTRMLMRARPCPPVPLSSPSTPASARSSCRRSTACACWTSPTPRRQVGRPAHRLSPALLMGTPAQRPCLLRQPPHEQVCSSRYRTAALHLQPFRQATAPFAPPCRRRSALRAGCGGLARRPPAGHVSRRQVERGAGHAVCGGQGQAGGPVQPGLSLYLLSRRPAALAGLDCERRSSIGPALGPL